MINGWKNERIGNLVYIVNGGTPSTNIQEYWNGDIIWVTPSDITKRKSKYISDCDRKITQLGLINSSATLVPKNTILLCTRATVGEKSIAKKEMATNQGFKNLICKNINYNYMYYALETVKKEMIDNSYGSTFLELSKKNLEKIEIKMPIDMREQKAIADTLTNIDNLIDLLQKTIEKKEKTYNSLLDELFGNKYNKSEDARIWRKVELVDLCHLITKQTGFDYTAYIKPNLIKTKNSNSLPMIQNKDFKNKEFKYSTDYYLSKNIANDFPKLWLKEPCLLITIVGSIGNIGLFNAEQEVFCGGAIGLLKFNKVEDLKYAYYCMKSKVGQNQLHINTKGSTQPTVTLEDIRKIWIPYFNDKQDRNKCVELLSELEDDIAISKKILIKYKQIKEGMMEDLLTGKVRLNYE